MSNLSRDATTPVIWLRAEVTRPTPLARTTKLDLISAMTGRPTTSRKAATLSRVTMAVMSTSGATVSATHVWADAGSYPVTVKTRAGGHLLGSSSPAWTIATTVDGNPGDATWT